MTAGAWARQMLRESRGARGRLGFFVACLAIGVAAVVAVAGLSGSLDDGIRREARQLLAADLAIESRRPLSRTLERAIATITAAPGASRTDVKEMVTIAAVPSAPDAGDRPGPSQLVELKVIDGDYPFYGKIDLEPRRPLSQLLGPGTVVVAPELLSRLGLGAGDEVAIGGERFRIAGVVRAEPDRISISLTLGPRVFMSADGLARTGLETRGSRVERRTLIKLRDGASKEDLRLAAARLRAVLPDPGPRLETFEEAQPALRSNLTRIGRFLGLVALLSLFIGGIGVAQSVRAWIAGRLDAIAVLKCLGYTRREVLALYLGQTALLGLAGSLVGIVLGAAVQLALPPLFPDLIPGDLIRPWQPLALLRGLLLGLGVAILFSLPPLAAVLRVPPARVLRRDADPLPTSRRVAGGALAALAAGILGMATAQSGSAVRGLQFTGGVAAVTVALVVASLLVSRTVGRLPREGGRLWLRHGLAALARPGAATTGAIVALGLGVLVVLAMSLVERRLAAELSADLPAKAPTAFMVDIQPEQWPGVRGILEQVGAAEVVSVPVVTARLLAIDGLTVDELTRGGEREGSRRWALTREQRLTYLDELPEDNEIVRGTLWGDPARSEVSVEEEFAGDIGVDVGSTLRFDVQGVPIEVAVTSIRTVDWRTFGINFFLVVEPGVLEAAPQQRLAVARLPRDGEQRLQDRLAASFPNITLLRIREILEKIVSVLERIGLGIRFLGGFTVIAGIAILGGAISAGSARRGREVALLKTLGVTRFGVAATFAVEYALIGLVAGAIGACGGAVLAWGVLSQGFELEWRFELAPLLVAVAASALLTVTAGLAASLRALQRRPIEVLRGE